MSSSEETIALSTGTVLNRRYRVNEVLGAGGFGITYRATDTELQRTVAVKELYPEDYRLAREGTAVSVPSAKRDEHQEFVERVLKQGVLHRKLDHPHLMSVYEAFKTHDTAYLVAEYLEGISLRNQLERKGSLSEAEVWRLIEGIGDGLRHMHEKGALHLDVKPANIVKASGNYVVIDYGAGRMNSATESVELSTGGFTPAYAAAEQADGTMEKGPYTDLYALGATAYECATGERPPTSMARMMMEGELTWPSGLGGSLMAALEEALRVKPEERPDSVSAWLLKSPRGTESSTEDEREPEKLLSTVGMPGSEEPRRSLASGNPTASGLSYSYSDEEVDQYFSDRSVRRKLLSVDESSEGNWTRLTTGLRGFFHRRIEDPYSAQAAFVFTIVNGIFLIIVLVGYLIASW